MSEKVYSNKNAQDLFPALFEDIDHNKSLKEKPRESEKSKKFDYSTRPRPPDISPLRRKTFTDISETDSDSRKALILTDDEDHLSFYKKVLQSFQFIADLATSEAAAIDLISLNSFSALIYDTSLEFHNFEMYMRNLAGDKRRNLYYIIIGPDLRTLYDLEALCLSANLVVNKKDVKHLALILKRGFQDYQALFGPFIDVLKTSEALR